MASSTSTTTAPVITPEQLLGHWQGHRRVTRRMIEAFPEDQLFSFSIGGMRSFGDLVREFLAMDAPMVQEIVGGGEPAYNPPQVSSKEELLRLWNEHTAEINRLWAQLPAERFQETATVAGQYTSQVWDLLWYGIDNEIHHRGQGYVYLRALGIEPPPFYDRS